MMHCKEIGQLISEGLDRDLPRGQRWKIRMHLSFCIMCRRVSRQFQFLRRMAIRLSAGTQESLIAEGALEAYTLPPDARDRIRKRLRQDDSS